MLILSTLRFSDEKSLYKVTIRRYEEEGVWEPAKPVINTQLISILVLATNSFNATHLAKEYGFIKDRDILISSVPAVVLQAS